MGWKEFHEPVTLERAILEIAILLIVVAIIVSIVWGG